MYTCRECEREVNQATEICPYCGADLSVPPEAEGALAKKQTTTRIVFRWVALIGVLAVALWGFLWYILPARNGNPTLDAEARAVGALSEVRAALATYADAQGGAYPASLEALGDRARVPAQAAQSAGYQLQYVPGSLGADGIVHTYALLARAGNFGFRNFYTDETGVLRSTQENRAATAQDSPIANATPPRNR